MHNISDECNPLKHVNHPFLVLQKNTTKAGENIYFYFPPASGRGKQFSGGKEFSGRIPSCAILHSTRGANFRPKIGLCPPPLPHIKMDCVVAPRKEESKENLQQEE